MGGGRASGCRRGWNRRHGRRAGTGLHPRQAYRVGARGDLRRGARVVVGRTAPLGDGSGAAPVFGRAVPGHRGQPVFVPAGSGVHEKPLGTACVPQPRAGGVRKARRTMTKRQAVLVFEFGPIKAPAQCRQPRPPWANRRPARARFPPRSRPFRSRARALASRHAQGKSLHFARAPSSDPYCPKVPCPQRIPLPRAQP